VWFGVTQIYLRAGATVHGRTLVEVDVLSLKFSEIIGLNYYMSQCSKFGSWRQARSYC